MPCTRELSLRLLDSILCLLEIFILLGTDNASCILCILLPLVTLLNTLILITVLGVGCRKLSNCPGHLKWGTEVAWLQSPLPDLLPCHCSECAVLQVSGDSLIKWTVTSYLFWWGESFSLHGKFSSSSINVCVSSQQTLRINGWVALRAGQQRPIRPTLLPTGADSLTAAWVLWLARACWPVCEPASLSPFSGAVTTLHP